MSAEAFASLDSMEGIELPRPRSQTPSRAGIWSRLGLLAALCIAAAAWAVHLLFPPVSAAILAIVSLANLPVNIAGALMMLLALALFVADLKANTHGILSFGGVLSLLLGMAFLVNTGPIGLGVNPLAVIVAAGLTTAFFVFFIRKVWTARRRPVTTGAEALVGARGEAREDLSPEGLVFVRGALWKAVASATPIPIGSQVRVVGRKGLQLQVVAGETETKKEDA